MAIQASRNLHVPLPDPMYKLLRLEAERSQRPATVLAREAIEKWLLERQKLNQFNAVAEYARAVAGTRDDLDEDLEGAGIEHLLSLEDSSEEDSPK